MVKARNKEISLGEDFGDVCLIVNGARVQVRADGSVLAYTKGDVDAYTDGSVKAHPPVNGDAAAPQSKAPVIGDRMPDGTIYAGVSPNSGKAMYTTPEDAPPYSFNEAQKIAAKLDALGHQDWRVPTKSELNVLFNNRAAIGGFNPTGEHPSGWYWSASEAEGFFAWGQQFRDGYRGVDDKGNHLRVRYVR